LTLKPDALTIAAHSGVSIEVLFSPERFSISPFHHSFLFMNSPQPLLLGITGGIACGKTEAGCVLADQGWRVLDTDTLAHEVMSPGTAVFAKVVEHFGKTILSSDGMIDRTRLGAVVFEKPQERKILNRLTHPAVIAAAQEWMAECRAAGRDAAVLVPLLFEAGWTGGWDAVVCVTAPEEQVFQRLEKRGLSNEEAQRRMSAQLPTAEKAARADFIIDNNGTLEALRSKTLKIVAHIRNERKTHE
jgi:dephospho-CoA kinase